MSWAAAVFEVRSTAPIDVGVDGEARAMEPPLQFAIKDERLRVRLPMHAVGYSPAARALGWREALRDLWNVVRGRRGGLSAGMEDGRTDHVGA
jgi:hypothetical protein